MYYNCGVWIESWIFQDLIPVCNRPSTQRLVTVCASQLLFATHSLPQYLPSFQILSFFIYYQFIRVIKENVILGRSVVKEKGRKKGGEEKRREEKREKVSQQMNIQIATS